MSDFWKKLNIRRVYVGPDERLKDKTAMVMPSPHPGFIRAQFDDMSLEEAFGWHDFPSRELSSIPGEAENCTWCQAEFTEDDITLSFGPEGYPDVYCCSVECARNFAVQALKLNHLTSHVALEGANQLFEEHEVAEEAIPMKLTGVLRQRPAGEDGVIVEFPKEN